MGNLQLVRHLWLFPGFRKPKLGRGTQRLRVEIKTLAASLNEPYLKKNHTLLLEELQSFALPVMTYTGVVLEGQISAAAARRSWQKPNSTKANGKVLDAKAENLKSKDPSLSVRYLLVPEYEESQMAFQAGSMKAAKGT